MERTAGSDDRVDGRFRSDERSDGTRTGGRETKGVREDQSGGRTRVVPTQTSHGPHATADPCVTVTLMTRGVNRESTSTMVIRVIL